VMQRRFFKEKISEDTVNTTSTTGESLDNVTPEVPLDTPSQQNSTNIL
jgi:hypothetical protein